MSPELSRRLGEALGAHFATLDEQAGGRDALRGVETWDDLPADVRALILDIESRPGTFDDE